MDRGSTNVQAGGTPALPGVATNPPVGFRRFDSRRPARVTERRPSCRPRALDPDVDAVDGGERLRGQCLGGGSLRAHASVVQQGGVGSYRERVVGVVGGEDYREPVRRQSRDLAQHQGLVAEVEARGRLVHDQDRRLLRQRPGDQHELALAAGEPGVVGVGQILDVQSGQRGAGGREVGLARLCEEPEPRRTTHQDDLQGGVGEGRRVGLGHIGDTAGNFGPGEAGDRLPGQEHPSALRRQQSEQRLEQRRLAGPVGAEQAEHRAGAGRERDVRPDLVPRIADRQVPRLDRHAHARRPRARSHRKNGAPTTAVRMPSGTSTAEIVRARVSTASM